MRGILALATVVSLAACQRNEQPQAATVDCTRIGEALASFEVGATAPAEKRGPVAARYRASCESTHVTADEAACLGRAKDTWTARACLPRMFAAPAPAGEKADCALVVSRMRAAVASEVGQGSAAMAAIEKVLPTIQSSCEQDHWPAQVLDCVAATKVGDMVTFQQCASSLPKDLQDKLSQRLNALAAAQPDEPSPAAPPPSKPAP
ncbi:MAG TPA: hypothetical protein VFS15_00790 [Kofleriaceae bacterium]|nr:hypothetical protein [Kofleriaceae bacterium]